MEDFYEAMITYKNSKKLERICEHKQTFYCRGWKVCIKCDSYVERVFHQDLYSQISGYNLTLSKKNQSPKIKEIMTEMINSVTKNKIMLNNNDYYWDGYLKDGYPSELSDQLEDLYSNYININIKCKTRSLCAAILWNKAKLLYPKVMTLTKFSEKVGITLPTIIRVSKNLYN